MLLWHRQAYVGKFIFHSKPQKLCREISEIYLWNYDYTNRVEGGRGDRDGYELYKNWARAHGELTHTATTGAALPDEEVPATGIGFPPLNHRNSRLLNGHNVETVVKRSFSRRHMVKSRPVTDMAS